jgi:hypothetical protein
VRGEESEQLKDSELAVRMPRPHSSAHHLESRVATDETWNIIINRRFSHHSLCHTLHVFSVFGRPTWLHVIPSYS